MCSRFWGASEGVALLSPTEKDSHAPLLAPHRPNVAPSEDHPIIHLSHGKARVSTMKWGFTVGDQPLIVQAPAEMLLEKTLYSRLLKDRRCLLAVKGFYEWDKSIKPIQPYCFRVKDEPVFALAAIFREYVGHKQFVVVTTRANEAISKLHGRMPCVVAPQHFDLWLKGDCAEAVAKVCCPCPADRLVSYKVTNAMNNPKYKSEDAYEPLPVLFDFD